MDEPIVSLDQVTKTFRRTRAVDGLSLSIPPGQSMALIGRNGAGKTTLLRLIMGILRPTRGTVRLFGGDPIEEAERVKVSVGYLAEDQKFPGFLRPVDLFRFFGSCYPTWDKGFLETLANRFRIPVGQRMDTLSKGQARQVGLICAVVHRPRLLVLDEPGGGLDPVVRRAFLEEVIDLLSAEKTAVLFSSHNLQEVERLASRVGILDQGRLILDEDLDRLRESSCEVLASLGSDKNGTDADPKSRLPGCLRAERRGEEWRLVFQAAEPEARSRIEEAGGQVRQAKMLSLEDLFIALVGEEAA